VPFQIVGGLEFYQRKEVKDVLAYLQLLNNPRDDVAFARVVNTPTRGIGAKTIQRLAEHGRRYQLSMLEAAREAGLIESLSKRAAVMVAKFVSIVDRMSVGLASSTVEETMTRVLDESGYRHSLEMSDSEEDYDRLANVEELITAAREFDLQHAEDGGLDAFLEQVALVNETDNLAGEVDQVTLMTLHAAKGLEFPVVFIVALEQGLLPHEYSSNDPDQLEEERRLLFVGITRAEEELSLSTANYRSFRGEWRAAVPSEFLMELPRAEMELSESSFSDYGGGWDSDDRFEEQAWDDDFRDEEPADEYVHQEAETATVASVLRTASEMLEQPRAGAHYPPHVFRKGMIVEHPDYGSGTIIALAGSGKKRMATVEFFGTGEEHTFRLAFSPLSPTDTEM
ncbi:MAG: ATP-binding domain-containing protein, partial [Planctomycetales bacterium]|nr:ATP-binding domain-containing protein [Planctomycetales bacterium]